VFQTRDGGIRYLCVIILSTRQREEIALAGLQIHPHVYLNRFKSKTTIQVIFSWNSFSSAPISRQTADYKILYFNVIGIIKSHMSTGSYRGVLYRQFYHSFILCVFYTLQPFYNGSSGLPVFGLRHRIGVWGLRCTDCSVIIKKKFACLYFFGDNRVWSTNTGRRYSQRTHEWIPKVNSVLFSTNRIIFRSNSGCVSTAVSAVYASHTK